jgi:hypothetical protein
VNETHLKQYVREIRKPGYLEAMIRFLEGNIWTEIEVFKSYSMKKLQIPMLVIFGEASAPPLPMIQTL